MTTFDDRRDTFERKFAHDEELRFKAVARRNKLLGLWAAERMGKSAEEAQVYATAVVVADFEEAGDGDVIRKVSGDLGAAGKPSDETEIRAKLDEFLAKAVADIEAGR
jgi:hypothetical protein